jgi:outer membrane protein assembly factor BamB
MNPRLPPAALLLLACLTPALPAADQPFSWPAWRGDAAGSGQTGLANLPTEWSKTENIRWRTELPEAGNSTPIVFGDRVYLTQPVTADNWRGLWCVSLDDGSVIWKLGITYDKPERTHRTNPYCSASPATNGRVIVASLGSAGVIACDMDGKLLWHRDLGPIDHEWGNSTSPVLHGNLCIHYHGPGKGAFLTALDLESGATVWRFDEPDWQPGKRTDGFANQADGIIGSFSTPILARAGDRDELVMSFPMQMKAFDPASGSELWTCSGLNPLVYTSPMVSGDVVLAMGGYHGNSIGVRTGGIGDTTDARLWLHERHNGGIGTGVVKDGHYYYQNSSGIACCLNVGTGETLWQERLPGAGKSWGSFLLAGDLIYSLSQAGDTVVFRASPDKLQVVAQADLGEQTNSSPVPVPGGILIRTHSALWCAGRPEK